MAEPPYPSNASLTPDISIPPPDPINGTPFIEIPGNDCIPALELTSHLVASLDVSRLTRIYEYLWFAGRPFYIRPLHRQLLMRREIVVTEQADLHLVWWDNKIYIKPLPRFLLNHAFFTTNICANWAAPGAGSLLGDANGMLWSYTRLIQHESDFNIAIKTGLLPNGITWKQWSMFAALLRASIAQLSVPLSPRYRYGELRMFRLNILYRFRLGHLIRAYHLHHTNFNSFFGQNFTWPLVTFAYVTTMLNAMQVGLGTGWQDVHFVAAAFGFAVAMISTILITFFAVACLFLGLLIYNLVKALQRRRERLSDCSKIRERVSE